MPGPWPSGRASTKWTMFSAMSCSPEVMKRLTPSMCQVPSSCAIALVRPAPTSEPASGSVSTIVEPHSRSVISRATFCCSSVPSSCSTPANAGPEAYIHTAGLEPRMVSAKPHSSERGALVPPMPSGMPSRHHSASMYALKLFLNVSGTGAVLVSGSKTGGLRSASAYDSDSSFSASLAISASTSRAVSTSISANGPVP